MAIVRALKTGVWSDTTVWSTGALPTASDDVYSNTFTVTIDTSPTVLSISNAATTGVTAGGSFAPTNGITLTCTATTGVRSASATTLFACSLTSGQSCSLVANCEGPGSNSTLSTSVANTSSGTLNITGNCTAGSGGSLNSYAVQNTSTGTINITGNCTGTTGSSGIAVANTSTGTLNITGTSTGGTSATAYGCVNTSTGTLTHVGTAQAGTGAAAIGAGSIGQVTILSGPLLSTDASAGGAAASGVNPVVALRWFPQDTALGTFELRMRGQTVSGGARPARQFFFPDAYSATYPAASNVRSSTTYGPGSIYTGSCAVPSAASVLTGVPVDATTGTASAAFTAAGVRSAVGLSAANLDSQLSTLTTNTAPATIAAAVRTNLASELARAAQVATTQEVAEMVEGAV